MHGDFFVKLSPPLRSYLFIDPLKNQSIMKIQRILPVFLALALFGACKSSTTVVENEGGIIRGSVSLYNINGDSLSDHGGATISLQGTSYQGTSQNNGDFQLNNVPAGIYNVIVTKSGYDTELTSSYQFGGAGTQFLENQFIQAIPLDSVPILSIVARKMDTLYHNGDTGTYYILTLEFNVSAPDSLILKYFSCEVINPRIDTVSPLPPYPYQFQNDFVPNIPSQRPFTLSATGGLYPSPDPYGIDSYLWHPGDTVYVETKAIAQVINSTGWAGTTSPIISKKFIILP